MTVTSRYPRPSPGAFAEAADELDAGVIFGTGFAPFRGGPINHIRTVGKDAILTRLAALAQRHGPRFAPRPGWEEL